MIVESTIPLHVLDTKKDKRIAEKILAQCKDKPIRKIGPSYDWSKPFTYKWISFGQGEFVNPYREKDTIMIGKLKPFFAERGNLPATIVETAEYLGVGVNEVAELSKRHPKTVVRMLSKPEPKRRAKPVVEVRLGKGLI